MLGLALIVLPHGSAERAVALADLAVPCLIHLLTHHRMIEATVTALHEAAKRTGPVALPRFLVTAEADQAHQHGVVVGQAASRKLVPRGGPEQDGVPAGLRLFLRRQVTVAKTCDVQRHEGEVLQVGIRRHRRFGKGAQRSVSGA
ncbi:hypothetical protein EDF56_106342 [Novosphingobium sp. PhB165]|nr:hypothetical protein EDF56_106342 [Novosphingobium sp. PhB165]